MLHAAAEPEHLIVDVDFFGDLTTVSPYKLPDLLDGVSRTLSSELSKNYMSIFPQFSLWLSFESKL